MRWLVGERSALAAAFCVGCWTLALCDGADAWQLRPVAEGDAPALEKTPEEPGLLAPELEGAPLPASAEEANETPPPSNLPPPQIASPPETTDAASGADAAQPRPFRSQRGDRAPPNAAPAPETLARLKPGSFQGVTPGKTRRAELIAGWGQPQSETARNGGPELEFVVAPFERIDVTLAGDTVISLVGHFPQPVALREAQELLRVAACIPAAVYDGRGRLLGHVYPESGVLFGFSASGDSPRVAQVVVEPPSAEGFLARAEQRWRRQPHPTIADLEMVLALDPGNSRASAILAEIFLESDRAPQALATVEAALADRPQAVSLQLLRGRALLSLGRADDAEPIAEQVANQAEATPVDRAAAKLLEGDLLASPPRRDVRTALTRHYEAAELAAAAVQEAMRGEATTDDAYRRGLWVAVEAYLAVARDLAEGRWRRRQETFERWIDHAERTVEILAPAEVKDDWRFYVHRRAVEASAASGGKIDPAPYVAKALENGARLLATASDSLRRAQVQSQLGAALLETSEMLHVAGKREAARNYLHDAQRLLEAALSHNEIGPRTSQRLGRTYFVLGLDRAVDDDHRAAAQWYAKALPLWERPLPAGQAPPAGARGQYLVSMGVSFWRADERDQAITVTENGLRLLQQAVDDGQLDRTALAVPLANLASMNRALGNEEQAERYQTRLVDFQTPAEEEEKE